jgi:hypothetical protein
MHKRQLLVIFLSQINPVHITQSSLTSVRFVIYSHQHLRLLCGFFYSIKYRINPTFLESIVQIIFHEKRRT